MLLHAGVQAVLRVDPAIPLPLGNTGHTVPLSHRLANHLPEEVLSHRRAAKSRQTLSKLNHTFRAGRSSRMRTHRPLPRCSKCTWQLAGNLTVQLGACCNRHAILRAAANQCDRQSHTQGNLRSFTFPSNTCCLTARYGTRSRPFRTQRGSGWRGLARTWMSWDKPGTEATDWCVSSFSCTLATASPRML